jgi:hypothetical protein
MWLCVVHASVALSHTNWHHECAARRCTLTCVRVHGLKHKFQAVVPADQQLAAISNSTALAWFLESVVDTNYTHI